VERSEVGGQGAEKQGKNAVAASRRICETSPPKFGFILALRKTTVVQRFLHFTRRLSVPAALLLSLLAASGCALMKKDTWNLNNYRDERAVDIDTRLEKTGPNVKNPF
jgi:hypothetical protein